MNIDEHEAYRPDHWSTQDAIAVPEPEEWREKGVHWHGYVELRDGTEMFSSLRDERLGRVPDAVIHTPKDVADWICRMFREEARQDWVRLIGTPGGDGKVGDQAHLDHEWHSNLEIAARGDSIYADVNREHGRMYLWVEAVTEPECTVHTVGYRG
ncbi:hypothetical protein [Parasphingorhabdus pacifica]